MFDTLLTLATDVGALISVDVPIEIKDPVDVPTETVARALAEVTVDRNTLVGTDGAVGGGFSLEALRVLERVNIVVYLLIFCK